MRNRAPPARMTGSGEFAWIARHFAPLAASMPGADGLTDDAFVGKMPPGRAIVLSADALVAGVHFFAEMAPADIARRALRVNLSDLAAKGALPIGYLLTLALPDATTEDWVAEFAAGLGTDQTEFGLSLLGGDTVRIAGPLVVSIAVVGHAAPGRAPRRSQARSGDRILVSGTIGDAAFGLDLLARRRAGRAETRIPAASADYLRERYERPQPRLALGQALSAGGLVHAMMDVSDGLVGDLMRIAEASGIGADLRAAEVPISPAAREYLAESGGDLARAITGGDDYELLLTTAPENVAELRRIAGSCRVPLTEIGFMTEAKGVTVADEAGRAMTFDRPGYRHF